MSTGVIQWSQTAATNATADSSINFAEGQAPSSVNDSCRALMAAAAKWRDDISGILVTGGTSTAYTITSNEVIAANINGMTVQFTPGTTNTGAVTLAVDGQTARGLRFITGTDLPAGVLLSGSLYQATYRAATTEWLLHSFDARQWVVPLGSALPYFGSSAPNSAFVFPYGQALNRTTYATLFTLFSTTYGVGDGSTTFNIPDLRGRVVAGKDNMGGSAASRLTTTYYGTDPTAVGAVGGSEYRTIAQANLPAATLTTTITDPGHTHLVAMLGNAGVASSPAAGSSGSAGNATTASRTTGITASTDLGGSGTGFPVIQPTIIADFIMRVI